MRGLCVGGFGRGDWERRGKYVTARREWTKLDRNVPNLVSFCTKEENTNFFTQPLVLYHQHCSQAKSCKVSTTFLDSFWGSDWGWGTQILLRLRHSCQRNLKFQSYSGRGIHSMNFNISETVISSSKRLCGARMKQLNKFQDRTGQNEGKPSFNFCFGVLVILQPVWIHWFYIEE